MARVNKCKLCGVTELPEGATWIGTNHNLCSSCVTQSETYQKNHRYPRIGMNPLAVVAAAMLGGKR